MLLYYCASAKKLKRLATAGLSQRPKRPWTLHPTLQGAQAECGGKHIVVLNSIRLALPVPITTNTATETVIHVDAIPKKAALNLNPYIRPTSVVAAGGYVVRSGSTEPEVLLIFRRGVWDLPKGKLDPGETIEACALREVQEEVGIQKLAIMQPLGTTVHTYVEKNYFRIKTTYWYQMTTPETKFTPQAEENIEAVKWMPWSKALASIGYATLRDHMRQITSHVQDQV